MSCPGFYRQISRNNIDISEFLSIFNEKLKTEKKLFFRHAALQIQIEPTKFTIEIYPDIFFNDIIYFLIIFENNSSFRNRVLNTNEF